MQQKNLVMYIILSIVTCGVFALYWYYCIATDLYNAKQDSVPTTPIITLILYIVTGSIYGIYAYYKWGKDMPAICAEKGVTVEDRSIVYVLLAIFGLSIVNMALIQNDLNLIADSAAK